MASQEPQETVQNLLKFLDDLLARSNRPGSIIPMITAVRQIFGMTIGKDSFDSVDINTINVEDYFFRFRDLTIGRYSHKSYKTYRSRVHKAIRIYKDHVSRI